MGGGGMRRKVGGARGKWERKGGLGRERGYFTFQQRS